MVSFISTFFPTVQGGVVGTAGLAWDHERKELGRGGGGVVEEHKRRCDPYPGADCILIRQAVVTAEWRNEKGTTGGRREESFISL